MRHDGTEVCVAKEEELLKDCNDDDTTHLHSLGIRRWKYQKILYDACVKVGIIVHLGKRLIKVTSLDRDSISTELQLLPMTKLEFLDKSTITCSLLIGADGLNSTCRRYVSNPLSPTIYPEPEEYVPIYTGVTCLMGCANVPFIRGICFPSSATTKCHGCFYPTHVPPTTTTTTDEQGENNDENENEKHEMIFQLYFPSPIERPDQWRTLTPDEAKIEGRELAARLRNDGWDEMFLTPLEHDSLTGVLRVGIRNREALTSWHVPKPNGPTVGPVVLLGDAAHPPVPYIGQGAMMATEDAGTLALVLKEYCPLVSSTATTTTTGGTSMLDLSNFSKAMDTYEQLRVGRVTGVLGASVELGKTQQKRADSKLYNLWRELSIKTQVWLHGTLPVMRLGAAFDYRAKVQIVEPVHGQNE
jgi:2-polyprenyl-6-methoxyphenol hydroxylase-like FAD-dependent oxidoreductase